MKKIKSYRIYYRKVLDGVIDVRATTKAQAKKKFNDLGTVVISQSDWEIVESNIESVNEDKN